jgi:hypothetical protein
MSLLHLVEPLGETAGALGWSSKRREEQQHCEGHSAVARETLAESRTMKGGGLAGVATIGAAGVEIARDVLAETQAAVQPLVPYLDALRWVFIAAALAGTAVTIYARLDDWRRGRR